MCLAVGYYVTWGGLLPGSSLLPISERWDGTRWSFTQPAGWTVSGLSGLGQSFVSCNGPGVCWTDNTSWAGSRWQPIGTVPGPAGEYTNGNGMSCASASLCEIVFAGPAAGNNEKLIADRYHNGRWQPQPIPSPPRITSYAGLSVSCARTGLCALAGSGQVTDDSPRTAFVENWDGRHWSLRPLPGLTGQDANLTGVACAGTSSCMATGQIFERSGASQMVAERWDGHSWHRQLIPSLSGLPVPTLLALSCATSTKCVAVGLSGSTGIPIQVRWDGRRWTAQPFPDLASNNVGTSPGAVS
jgi:hypothetical protein